MRVGLLEMSALDDKALVGGAANFAGVVIHHGAEGQLAAVHGGQFTFTAHHHANGCGGVVGQFQLGANGAAAGVQLRGNALPAGFFNQCGKGGGGEHIQLTAAHGGSGIGGGYGNAGAAFDSGIQHSTILLLSATILRWGICLLLYTLCCRLNSISV